MKIFLIRVYNFLYYTPAKYIALALKLLKVPARTESYIFKCDLSNNINFTYSLVGYRHFKNNYPAAEVETWNWLGKNLKESGAIIDVGANVGQFSLVANGILKKNFPFFSDKLVLIEPSVRNFELLSRNSNNNKLNSIQLNCALGSKSESQTLRIHEVYGRIDYRMQFNVQTLDSLGVLLNLSSVQLIKIDTDGHELSILKGGRSFLQKNRPTLIIEMNKSTAKQSGVDLYEIENELSSINYIFTKVLDSENYVYKYNVNSKNIE